MEFHRIDVILCSERGKGPFVRFRRAGKVPVVVYGGDRESTSITINPKDLLTALNGPWGRNVVFEVTVEGEKPFPALLADYSYHPLNRSLLHVDFLSIDLNKPVDVDIPFLAVGKAAGVVEGGSLRQIFRTLPITCLPSMIPQSIEFDVSEMNQNDVRKVSDLQLPEGVTLRLPAELTVVAVDAAVAEEEETEGEAAGEGEAAPAAAAPEAEKK
jgi:large subunit ribosomal protein L25